MTIQTETRRWTDPQLISPDQLTTLKTLVIWTVASLNLKKRRIVRPGWELMPSLMFNNDVFIHSLSQDWLNSNTWPSLQQKCDHFPSPQVKLVKCEAKVLVILLYALMVTENVRPRTLFTTEQSHNVPVRCLTLGPFFLNDALFHFSVAFTCRHSGL